MKPAVYFVIAPACLLFCSPAVAQSTATVPPPKAKPKPVSEELVDAAATTNNTTGLLFDTAIAAGPDSPEIAKQAGKISDGFGAIGLGLTATQMTNSLYKGDTDAVLNQSGELLVDATALYGCSLTGPAAGPCSAAYGLGKVAGQSLSYGVKSWTGKDIGEHAYDAYEAGKESLFPDTDPDRAEYWAKLKKEHSERAKAASQCHPGHDEVAHPGGCNSPRVP
jgi:hypothetical protein